MKKGISDEVMKRIAKSVQGQVEEENNGEIPPEIEVWVAGGSWDGLAVDSDDDPVHWLRIFLEEVGEEVDPDEWWATNEPEARWENYVWDEENGVYKNRDGQFLDEDDITYIPHIVFSTKIAKRER